MKKEPRHFINEPQLRHTFTIDEFYRRVTRSTKVRVTGDLQTCETAQSIDKSESK